MVHLRKRTFLRSRKQLRLFVFGTSLSAERTILPWRQCGGDWVYLLREHARTCQHELSVINGSRWGANSGWALRHFRDRALLHAPTLIVFEFAINDADIRNSISVAESENNLHRMIYLARQIDGECAIWLMTSHVPAGRHKTVRPALNDYYAMYRSLARQSNLGLIDLHQRWGATPPDDRYLTDGIHTNALAAQEVILPFVLSQLKL